MCRKRVTYLSTLGTYLGMFLMTTLDHTTSTDHNGICFSELHSIYICFRGRNRARWLVRELDIVGMRSFAVREQNREHPFCRDVHSASLIWQLHSYNTRHLGFRASASNDVHIPTLPRGFFFPSNSPRSVVQKCCYILPDRVWPRRQENAVCLECTL